MTLDRTTTPPVGTFPPLSLPAPGIHALSNGIEIIACNRGDEDVCRIDLIFEGGYYTEQKPGTAALTLLMLKEGAAGKSSEEIAESFDYHGAWLQTSASSHYLYVTLYTLNRHLDTCLSLLADIVIRPDSRKKEFTRLKERRLQQLLVQKEKSRRPRLRDFSLYDFRGQAPLRTGCHPRPHKPYHNRRPPRLPSAAHRSREMSYLHRRKNHRGNFSIIWNSTSATHGMYPLSILR